MTESIIGMFKTEAIKFREPYSMIDPAMEHEASRSARKERSCP